MRDIIDLRRYWREHAGEALALCTLIRKTGSAYRAPGARKIVARDGGACGLLSGGCLEPAIEAAARENWDGLPVIRSFSTMSPEDKLLGYQTGCAGAIDLLIERLPPRPDDIDLYFPFGRAAKAAGVAVSLAPESLGARRWAAATDETSDNIFLDRWITPVHLQIIGCGIDAAPFLPLARRLGWDISFLDYRESLRGNLPEDADVTIAPLDDLPPRIAEGGRNAVLLMTHNYQADLALLRALAERKLGYIGSLGPCARFAQMRAELGFAPPPAWQTILHAPAGIFGGSHTPDSIALSVVAEIAALLGDG